MAVELIRHSDSRLDRQQLTQFLNSYQRVAPLTIGELWAWPSMLKLALIENLRRLADELLAGARRAPRRRRLRVASADDGARRRRAAAAAPTPPSSSSCCIASASTGCGCSSLRAAVDDHLASRQTTAEETIRGEHQRQAVAQVSVANAITSLRLCATLDWREYVEVGQPGRAGAAARSGRRLRRAWTS